ncbi:uncharacterized protein LOC126656985 [Mercurialis annua]|uniref:uncharacterized protein LOC126656985 n=1 Tax=Mercurialis annua TaxID=3986 RepID=UPI002160DE47|nr:uncharacterized protein LOC126656985 [Mercurialis annua]
MGALAPLSSWIPEDDLLLKNAVEAGASLESLAKGAVQFSRKFTVRELQERWHSLLYDPIVSANAAFHMIEFERSASTLPSKFTRTGNLKENRCISGKRKAESVRSCYYALRKRIRNDPFNTMDLSFLIAPTDSNYIVNEDEPFSGNCIIEDPISTHFELEDSNLDIMHHNFPEMGDDPNAHAFDPQFDNTVHGDYPMELGNVHEEIPQLNGENISHLRNRSVIDEFSGPIEMPENNDQVHECSNFDGDHVFSSPIPECNVSFHNLEFSSPLPEMPIWRTVEGMSPPSMPIDMHTEDTFSLPDNDASKNTCLSEYDVHGDSNSKLQIPSGELKNVTTSTEGYLAELSNSLLNFTNEEELLFTDVDGKDAIDKSYYDGLSSLLLNSPNDVNQDHMVNITELDSSLTSDYTANQCGASHKDLDEDRGSYIVGNSELQLPELCVEDIICTLNMEDQEIPCNDHVVFTNQSRPKSFSSVSRRNLHDPSKPNPSTFKEFSSNPKGSEVVALSMKKDLETPGQSHASSQILKSKAAAKNGLLQTVGDHGVKFDLPSGISTCTTVGVAYDRPSQLHQTNAIAETVVAAKPKEETPEAVPVKFSHNTADSVTEKAFNPDGYKCYPQINATNVKQDPDATSRIQNHQAAHVKLGSTDIVSSEQVVQDLVSDPEEPLIESEDDVPNFSDIEAMILDMDLDPEDQDLYSSEEVSRYQHEDTKKLIMRLEQGAQSYMRRAIALQGAFAVLYGRHSKHYIKKPEVLLGRATEDVSVDIDLGREGCANKISRRQATINLDKNGSFLLKNLGKSSISVNDKEIGPGQSLGLTFSCLIEIKGMPFIFETNPARVKQYLDGAMQKDETQEHQLSSVAKTL